MFSHSVLNQFIDFEVTSMKELSDFFNLHGLIGVMLNYQISQLYDSLSNMDPSMKKYSSITTNKNNKQIHDIELTAYQMQSDL